MALQHNDEHHLQGMYDYELEGYLKIQSSPAISIKAKHNYPLIFPIALSTASSRSKKLCHRRIDYNPLAFASMSKTMCIVAAAFARSEHVEL